MPFEKTTWLGVCRNIVTIYEARECDGVVVVFLPCGWLVVGSNLTIATV